MNRGLPTLLVAVTLCGMAQLAAAQAERPVFSETQPLSRVLRVDDAMPTDIAGIRSHIDTNYHEDQKDQHGLPAFPSDRGPDKPKQPTDATPTHKVTFTGVLIVGEQATPGQNHRLVVWSDDGVDVRIDGQTVLARGEEMQKLEDESSSVHLVPETVALVPGEQYGVEIDYYNHYYTGAADWDGVTLFFVGGEGELAYGAAELELYDPTIVGRHHGLSTPETRAEPTRFASVHTSTKFLLTSIRRAWRGRSLIGRPGLPWRGRPPRQRASFSSSCPPRRPVRTNCLSRPQSLRAVAAPPRPPPARPTSCGSAG